MQDRRYPGARSSDDCASPPVSGTWGRRVLRGFFVCAAAMLLASCRMAGVLDPKGPIAAQELMLLINTTEIMLVVVVPVILLTLGFAWWYRASNPRANHSPDWAYQGGVEFVVWSIPALIVILVGCVAWIGSHQLDPKSTMSIDKKPVQLERIVR